MEFGEAGVDEVLQKRTVQMTLVNFKALLFKLRTVARRWSCTRGPSSSSCSIVQLQSTSVSGAAEATDMRTADTSRFEESQGCKMNEKALNGVEGAADREAED